MINLLVELKLYKLEKIVIKLMSLTVLGTIYLGTLPEYVLAENRFDFSLIVGEWSEKGKCNSSRYVFMPDGSYQSLVKKKDTGSWNIFFLGKYERKSSDSLAITHTNSNNESFEDILHISSLNSKVLSGTWAISIGDDEAISISWQRCLSSR
ncbi:hypothetical protein NIES22_22450 [Calothrix brevissima NIES-22]|nr:hypothetical protein NIES22_22450 [Calothrix brevissima NIES-22]